MSTDLMDQENYVKFSFYKKATKAELYWYIC